MELGKKRVFVYMSAPLYKCFNLQSFTESVLSGRGIAQPKIYFFSSNCVNNERRHWKSILKSRSANDRACFNDILQKLCKHCISLLKSSSKRPTWILSQSTCHTHKHQTLTFTWKIEDRTLILGFPIFPSSLATRRKSVNCAKVHCRRISQGSKETSQKAV